MPVQDTHELHQQLKEMTFTKTKSSPIPIPQKPRDEIGFRRPRVRHTTRKNHVSKSSTRISTTNNKETIPGSTHFHPHTAVTIQTDNGYNESEDLLFDLEI